MFQRKLRGARLQLLEKEPCSEAGGRRSISRKFIGRRGTRQMVKSRQPSCKLSEQKPRACPEVYVGYSIAERPSRRLWTSTSQRAHRGDMQPSTSAHEDCSTVFGIQCITMRCVTQREQTMGGDRMMMLTSISYSSSENKAITHDMLLMTTTQLIVVIPAKAFARDYVITGVCLSVCLSVTTITK